MQVIENISLAISLIKLVAQWVITKQKCRDKRLSQLASIVVVREEEIKD